MDSNKTPAAMLAEITARLGLEDRTIMFHIMDTGYDTALASGSILDMDDITERSDAFLDLALEYDAAPALTVWNITTYMLGSGEADAATEADIDYLARIRDDDRRTFDDMLREYADALASLDDLEVPNPYYTEEDD